MVALHAVGGGWMRSDAPCSPGNDQPTGGNSPRRADRVRLGRPRATSIPGERPLRQEADRQAHETLKKNKWDVFIDAPGRSSRA